MEQPAPHQALDQPQEGIGFFPAAERLHHFLKKLLACKLLAWSVIYFDFAPT